MPRFNFRRFNFECFSFTFAAATQMSEDNRVYHLCLKNLGEIASAEGRTDAALIYFERAVRIDSTDIVLWSQLGIIAMQLKK